jgi:hypothetical protein
MPQPSSARPITGDEIISELIRNVEAGAFKVRYTVLFPCIFNVYLHADDYDQIRPISEFVRAEAKAALADHLASLNKAGPSITRWLGIGGDRQIAYKILESDWSVEFHRDEEDRLRRGDIEVYSELGTGERADLGAGAKTTFITRRPAEQSDAAAPGPSTQRTDREVFGYLRYKTAMGGDATFPITRDLTVIGRGGKAFWVDLRVEGPADVSREHCRIRRDAPSGEFFIKDLSQYGTTVNGQEVPTSLDRTESGEKIDKNVEAPLPDRANIGLAGVFFIQFETVQPE